MKIEDVNTHFLMCDFCRKEKYRLIRVVQESSGAEIVVCQSCWWGMTLSEKEEEQ